MLCRWLAVAEGFATLSLFFQFNCQQWEMNSFGGGLKQNGDANSCDADCSLVLLTEGSWFCLLLSCLSAITLQWPVLCSVQSQSMRKKEREQCFWFSLVSEPQQPTHLMHVPPKYLEGPLQAFCQQAGLRRLEADGGPGAGSPALDGSWGAWLAADARPAAASPSSLFGPTVTL